MGYGLGFRDRVLGIRRIECIHTNRGVHMVRF